MVDPTLVAALIGFGAGAFLGALNFAKNEPGTPFVWSKFLTSVLWSGVYGIASGYLYQVTDLKSAFGLFFMIMGISAGTSALGVNKITRTTAAGIAHTVSNPFKRKSV